MNKNLYAILIQRDLITTETVVRANVDSIGFHQGSYVATKDIHWFPQLDANQIVDIEGMDPTRFAKSYGIKPDGATSSQKKRGRKPKLLAIEQMTTKQIA